MRGGMSGSDVWRGEDAGGTPVVALKRWPAETTASRLLQVHAWMREAAHLPFVPDVVHAGDGSTVIEQEDRLWDATRWMEGQACVRASAEEVALACEAAASLHEVWSRHSQVAPSPGVRRRVEVLEEWPRLSRQRIEYADRELVALLGRADALVGRTAGKLLDELRPRQSLAVQVQPCLRDLRGDHVLFDAGRVAGVIDYGAMGIDSPALDLARLLGDLAGGDAELIAAGLNRYRVRRPNFDVSDEFVAQLERVGLICSLVGWRVRFSRRDAPEFNEEMRFRLTSLIARAELFQFI